MSTVRYFEDDDSTKRIVEHRTREKVSSDDARLGYEIQTKRRWFTIEEYDGSRWVEVEELGDYVEPKNAPHK